MATDPLVGKVLADRFHVIERIGEGGTGVVYKARQMPVDKEIAIKVLGAHVSSDPQWVKRFHNEAKVAALLDHPNTVRFIDFGQTKEGLFFIAMELLQGRSLRDEIDRVGRMPPQRALRILVQACGSVAEAHGRGIIHRDIKPDNLFLIDGRGPGDFVKVLDFSVAKIEQDSMQTRAGIVFGTPSYMSPEQGSGKKLGPQSDIYALGIVFYEMLTGKPPFESKIPTEVVMMHLRDKPAPLVGMPDVVQRIAMRMLEKDSARRQQTCDELKQECEQALAELNPSATPNGMIIQQSTGNSGPHRPVTGPNVQVSGMASGSGQIPAARPVSGPNPAVADARTMLPNASDGQRQAIQQAQERAAHLRAQQPSDGPRTMIADELQLPASIRDLGAAPPTPTWSPPGASSAPPQQHGGMAPGGTMILPDSSGVVAFAVQQAEAARAQAAHKEAPNAPPAPWYFWAAWMAMGIGMGIAVHFLMLQKQLAAG